jgi:hypothetical protein
MDKHLRIHETLTKKREQFVREAMTLSIALAVFGAWMEGYLMGLVDVGFITENEKDMHLSNMMVYKPGANEGG